MRLLHLKIGDNLLPMPDWFLFPMNQEYIGKKLKRDSHMANKCANTLLTNSRSSSMIHTQECMI